MGVQTSATPIQHQVILSLVKSDSSVLDLGCGNGELMMRLEREKGVRAQGIEILEEAIYKCVAQGLRVVHGDIDSGLSEYGDNIFDYVILNHTLQQVKRPDMVLNEAIRVGKEVIVGFPNFAHFSVRLNIGFRGRTPVTPSLPYQWYNSPNLHFLSISDFFEFCAARQIEVEKFIAINKRGRVHFRPNLLGESGIFLISKSRV